MARTLADYSTKYKLSHVFGNLDNSELAARINPISVLDRAGHVIWYDDFEGTTLKWLESNSGAGATCSISTAKAQFGNQSLRMVAGSDVAAYARVVKPLDILPTSKMGWEFYFNVDANVAAIDLDIDVFNGTRQRRIRLTINFDSDTIRIQTRYAGWITVEPVADTSTIVSRFHWLKFTVDLSDFTWGRLIYKGISHDLSAYQVLNIGATTSYYTNIALYVKGDLATNAVGHIDNFIVTMDEP